MLKVRAKNCLRCGSEKGEEPNSCNVWGTYFGRHMFTYMKPVTKKEKRIADLEFQLMLKS